MPLMLKPNKADQMAWQAADRLASDYSMNSELDLTGFRDNGDWVVPYG